MINWSNRFDVQLATEDDLLVVMEILMEAAGWLTNKGVEQWPASPREYWQRRVSAALYEIEL